jgi:hypothetical protein
MRSFLINKNLSFYYWLRKRIGKNGAFKTASILERMILIFGREPGGGVVKGRGFPGPAHLLKMLPSKNHLDKIL